MNVASVWLATALAKSVFPQPGGPTSRTPFGGTIPTFSKSSGFNNGSSMASRTDSTCSSRPATSSYDILGFSVISAPLTIGSHASWRISITERLSWLRATRVPGFNRSGSSRWLRDTWNTVPFDERTMARSWSRTSCK